MPKYEPYELSPEDIIETAMDMAWDACRLASPDEDGLTAAAEHKLEALHRYLTGALSDNSSLGPATADLPSDAPETV